MGPLKDRAATNAIQGKVAHYAFVGSAGAYLPDDIEPMLVEGDERKASAGHVCLLKADRFGRLSVAECFIKPDLRD